jgi:hypothetical protein
VQIPARSAEAISSSRLGCFSCGYVFSSLSIEQPDLPSLSNTGFDVRDLEQSIGERAYHLWINDGCHEGRAETHWLSAQREVVASSLEGFASVTSSKGVFSDRKTTGSLWVSETHVPHSRSQFNRNDRLLEALQA